MKKVTILAAAGALAACGALIPIPAGATQGHDKPWICHPVEGKGETGYGWNLINPDEASKHIDESTGAGKHTRKDGRTDVYAVDGVCPGAPVPTTEEPTPSTTAPSVPTTTGTATSTPSSPTQSPTSSVTSPPSPDSPSPSGTTTRSNPSTGPTPPTATTTATSSSPSRTSTSSRPPLSRPRGSVSSQKAPIPAEATTPTPARTLAYTGAKTKAAGVGMALLTLGLLLHMTRRRYLRQH